MNERRKADPDFAERSRKRTREWNAENPGASRRRQWEAQGMDPALAQAAWDAVKACQLCGSPRRLCVDHCHETGAVRGVLCTRCNTAIGKLGDNVAGLTKALDYLWGWKRD